MSRAARKRRRKLRLMKLFCREERLFSNLRRPASCNCRCCSPPASPWRAVVPKKSAYKERSNKTSLLYGVSSNRPPENLPKVKLVIANHFSCSKSKKPLRFRLLCTQQGGRERKILRSSSLLPGGARRPTVDGPLTLTASCKTQPSDPSAGQGSFFTESL